MNMNDVEVLTKNITIIVLLDGYDFNHPEDFDVTIVAGYNNKRVCTITPCEVKRQGYKDTCKVEYIGLKYFTLDNLNITCKYPVVVRCNDFIISKNIEPITTK